MSSIKLDPSFNRQAKPGRVGGFQPPPVPSRSTSGIGNLVWMVTIAAATGALIVYSYIWLLEF